MNKSNMRALTVIISMLFFVFQAYAVEQTPAKGEAFPNITLPFPEKADEKEYLGLTGKGSFKIPQIKAELIILEIFSMYCPYCQKEAPNLNELYQIINNI